MTQPLSPEMVAFSIGALAAGSERHWLSAAELQRYAGLRIAKRRRDWLAGRAAAKELVRRRYGMAGDGSLRSIEIVGEPKRRPGYRIASEPARFCLSISHSTGVAVAALGRSSDEWVGVDVEGTEERTAGFESLLLSAREEAALGAARGPTRWRALTRIWVVKEAISKALGIGLGFPLPLLESGLTDDDRASTTVAVPATIAALAGSAACNARVGLFELGALQGAWAMITGRGAS